MGRSGTGLGLTVVWNTLQEHDGYIDLSTDAQGTAFSLYFPITREAIPDSGGISAEDYGGEGQTVLVVDDQPQQRDIISAILTHLGYRVDAVSSGEAAVEYVKDQPVDLLVLDMIMDPGINGRETYERILELRPGQKAVIASGYAMTEEVKAAQKMGAGRYIKKPFTVEGLGMAVKAELAREPSETA
jgi:CheY-like chemotaxis protein